MKCEACGKKPATVHLTDIEENKKREKHLCEECAQTMSEGAPAAMTHADILTTLINQVAPELAEMHKTECSACGLSYLDFRSSGRLGCAQDYVAFKSGLIPLLEKIHGGTHHVGRVPKQAGEAVLHQGELLRLRKELGEAVKHEDYEQAAELRDRVRELTGKDDGNQ